MFVGFGSGARFSPLSLRGGPMRHEWLTPASAVATSRRGSLSMTPKPRATSRQVSRSRITADSGRRASRPSRPALARVVGPPGRDGMLRRGPALFDLKP
jgi:hypothetical protein